MTRGSKAKYTLAQRRKAAAIEASYEERGLSPEQAEARAWATVNKPVSYTHLRAHET